MAIQIRWAPKAATQLEQICEHISQDSEIYARIFAQKVLSMIEELALFPKIGRMVPEYNDPNLREPTVIIALCTA